jgi:hypothetical protein
MKLCELLETLERIRATERNAGDVPVVIAYRDARGRSPSRRKGRAA